MGNGNTVTRHKSSRKIYALIATILVWSVGCGQSNTDTQSDTTTPGHSSPTAVAESNSAAAHQSVIPIEHTSFNDVTRDLDRGGRFYMYVSTEQWLTSVVEQMNVWRTQMMVPGTPPQVQEPFDNAVTTINTLLNQSGLGALSGIGMSTIAREHGIYRNKVIAYRNADKPGGKLWELFGSESHDLECLKLLPPDTALAMFNDVDLPMLWEWLTTVASDSKFPQLQRNIAQLRTLMDAKGINIERLLASLDGQVGHIVTIDETRRQTVTTQSGTMELPTIATALVIKVGNRRLFDAIDNTLPSQGVNRTNHNGVELRQWVNVSPLPTVTPTIAWRDAYLILASNSDIVHRVMATQSSPDDGLISTSEFKQLAQDIPTRGVGMYFVSERLGKTLQTLISQATATNSRVAVPIAGWMKLMTGANLHSYGVLERREEGYYFTGNANTSVTKAVLVPASVTPVMLMTAMAVPAVAKSRSKARRINCAGNLKQIGLACLMYAGDHDNRFPSHLSELTDQGYLKSGPVWGCPEAPPRPETATSSNYVYVGSGLRDDVQNPSITVLAHDHAANHHGTWMNVLFVDGHVQGMAGASIEQLATSNGWILNTPPSSAQ